MSTLSAVAKHEYYVELGNALPPPVLDQPEYRERRLQTAIETFEALGPGDAYEARLAVRIVLCGAHAVDSLREAGVHREDFRKMTRCRAQAAGLMREERAGERMLAQEQKMRRATESVAGGMPAQPGVAFALPQQAAPRSAPPPIQAAVAAPQFSAAVPPAAAPIRPAATQTAPPPVQEAAEPPLSPEAIANAEAFAQENPVAAAQNRHDRGVTRRNTAYFRHVRLPTDPAVTDALVRGTSDLLTFLDEVGGDELDKAA